MRPIGPHQPETFNWSFDMRALIASVSLALLSTLAHAGEACDAKAIDKNGKALAGAAKSSFMKKCEKEEGGAACAAKAVDKNGKPLAGAAKNSFVKKCEKDMATAK
jgi:opacity protein-like surface antigen